MRPTVGLRARIHDERSTAIGSIRVIVAASDDARTATVQVRGFVFPQGHAEAALRKELERVLGPVEGWVWDDGWDGISLPPPNPARLFVVCEGRRP